jgi:hypothetical protein
MHSNSQPQPPPPPPILLEFDSSYYCLFQEIPSMGSPQFPLFSSNANNTPSNTAVTSSRSSNTAVYFSTISSAILELKSLFDLTNDVSLSFPQLELSLYEVCAFSLPHTNLLSPLFMQIG